MVAVEEIKLTRCLVGEVGIPSHLQQDGLGVQLGCEGGSWILC